LADLLAAQGRADEAIIVLGARAVAMTTVPYDNSVRIGYVRVSSRVKDHQSQLDAVAGAHCREVVVETASTRSDRRHPAASDYLDTTTAPAPWPQPARPRPERDARPQLARESPCRPHTSGPMPKPTYKVWP
jgi:hypothetical protein